jgi:phage/plasmid-associated DNA primase
MQFLLEKNFVGFPLDLSVGSDGKKNLSFRGPWGNITKQNFHQKFGNPNDKAFVVITGKVSNVTVFDFDDKSFYDCLCEKYGELLNCFTVYTNRGCHVYFEYDKRYKSPCTDVVFYDNCVQKVDLRNDNAVVLCPPTKYTLQNGSVFQYTSNDGIIQPIFDWLCKLVLPKYKVSKRPLPPCSDDSESSEDENDVDDEPEEINQNDNDSNLFQKSEHDEKWNVFLDLIPLISVERLSEYEEWIKITCAIYNTFGDKAKNQWKNLSRKSVKFNEVNNNKVWKNLRKNKYPRGGKKASFDVLIDAAKTDSPDEYAELTQLDDSIDWTALTHVQYAKKMKELFFSDDSLIFTGSNRPLDGFLFNGTFWQPLDPNRAYLKHKYMPQLFQYYTSVLKKRGPYMNEKSLLKLFNEINNLENMPFINNVIQALEIQCYQSNNIPWNHDIYLFAFNDCIFDLQSKQFIQPNVQQYINCTCGYNFYEYDEDANVLDTQYDDEMNTIDDFFSSVVINDNVKQYLLQQISSFMVQQNPEEKAFFWLGNGRNGKGVATQLIRSALGNYFCELKLEYYTKMNGGPDSPNCNLFNCRYGRLLNTSEVGEDDLHPDRPQKFLTEKLKTLTGRDQITTRKPHSADEVKFIPGHPLIQTNMMPTLPGIHLDESVSLRERIEIIQFPFSFITDKNKVRNEPTKYKLQDSTLKTLFAEDKYRNAFIRILIGMYGQRIPTPPEINQYRQQYFDENNVVKRWFEETYAPMEVGNQTDLSKLNRFNLKDMFTDSNIKGRSFDQFRKEISLVAGVRCTTNRKTSRGVFRNGNNFMLQGYQFISIDAPEDIAQTNNPQNLRFA